MKWHTRIHLVDKCLMVFMAILILQSAYNLFANEPLSTESNSIDIIVKTSAAAIFGYFISANFVRNSHASTDAKTKGNQPPLLPPEPSNTTKSKIGFSSPAESTQQTNGSVNFTPTENPVGSSRLQIIITAVIGITCLCILLIYRNFMPLSPSSAGTISQFRDFVSGCVGFLIGCATGSKAE